MKIYFAGSIRGAKGNRRIYRVLIRHLRKFGEVLTEHVASGETETSERRIYARDLRWLQSVDVMVAEVSTPSLGVGYEIAKAESWGKKILVLCRKSDDRGLSAMVVGNPSVTVRAYDSVDEAQKQIDDFLHGFT
ncbi:MAG: nucleoside 2-deoxyribosyltransferase [Candidatus Kerfeldbacteria bacterium]|nr:nucleoside 2-deoxyribosyltransferase [Candidatus Kerfeldbacteria bacterium]